MQNLTEQEVTILNDLFDVEDEVFPLNEFQKKALKNRYNGNLHLFGVFYNDDVIVIKNESTLKNWLYYAGFEYISQPDTIKKSGIFLALYHIMEHDDEGGRLTNMIEFLNKNK